METTQADARFLKAMGVSFEQPRLRVPAEEYDRVVRENEWLKNLNRRLSEGNRQLSDRYWRAAAENASYRERNPGWRFARALTIALFLGGCAWAALVWAIWRWL
jgi:hypothetical protein